MAEKNPKKRSIASLSAATNDSNNADVNNNEAKKRLLAKSGEVEKIVDSADMPTRQGVFGNPQELKKYTAKFQNKSLSLRLKETRRKITELENQLKLTESEKDSVIEGSTELNRQWDQLYADLQVLLRRIEPNEKTQSSSQSTDMSKSGSFRRMLLKSSQSISQSLPDNDAATEASSPSFGDSLKQRAVETHKILMKVVEAVEQSTKKSASEQQKQQQALIDELHVQVRTHREQAARAAEEAAAATERFQVKNKEFDDLQQALTTAERQRDKARAVASSSASQQNNTKEETNENTTTNQTAVNDEELKEAQALAQSRLTEIETLRQKLKESEQNIERVKLETSKTSNGDISNDTIALQQYLELKAQFDQTVQAHARDVATINHQLQQLEAAVTQRVATATAALRAEVEALKGDLKTSEQTAARLRHERRAIGLKLVLKETESPSKEVLEQYQKLIEAMKAQNQVLKTQAKRATSSGDVELTDDEQASLAALKVKVDALENECRLLRAAADADVQEIVKGAAKLEADLKQAQDTSNALMSEIEVIGQSFEESSEQATRLLQQLVDKDDAQVRLLQDKQKRGAEIRSLKEALVVKQQEFEKMQVSIKEQQELISQLETQIRLAEQMSAQKAELVASMQEQIDLSTSEALDVQEQRRLAAQAAATAEQQVKAAQDRAVENAGELVELQGQLKRAREAESSLRRRLSSARAIAGIAGGGDATDTIAYYRQKLTCSVCSDREKNAVITKCFHVFCIDCLQQNLRDRLRKCPGCGVKFGENDVQRIYSGGDE